ncbi:MAG: polymer-forming cytoskeletal protein [Spirochaetes bacterium]|nr:polymer-forming cytoskeletal protein [Spirochaetota bacterium]
MAHNSTYTHEDSFVNSIIGEGTTLRGEFNLNGLLRIDGVFYGKVKTNGKVLVGKNGVAECTIISGTVVIGGKVKGDILATERITLLSTGELIGNIKTPRLVIEEGVVFDGTCEIIEDKDKLIKIIDEFDGKNNGFNNTINDNTSKNIRKTIINNQLNRADTPEVLNSYSTKAGTKLT